MSIQKVYDFFEKAEVFYLATIDGDQPRVRPFSAQVILDDKLYFCTGTYKRFYEQLQLNPKIEMSATVSPRWIRLTGSVVFDNDPEKKAAFLETVPFLKKKYATDDELFTIFYLEDATATIETLENSDKETFTL